MMLIVAGLIKNIKHNQQAGGKPNCQSENVDKRKHLIPGKASKCDLKEVFYHRRPFIKSRTKNQIPRTKKIKSSNIRHPVSSIQYPVSLRSQTLYRIRYCRLLLPRRWRIAMTGHSVLKDFTGFAIAAFMAWKLTVISVITSAPIPETINIQNGIPVLYSYCFSHPFK